MAPLPRVTLVASASIGLRWADGLRARGITVDIWVLPDDCSASHAGELAEEAAQGDQWGTTIRQSDILLTAVRDPGILRSVVVPFVLPHLSTACLWMQMGPISHEATSDLLAVAAEHEITLVNMPLQWDGPRILPPHTPDGLTALRGPDADLVYGLVVAALLESDGPGAATTQRSGAEMSMQPLDELDLWEMELRGWVSPPFPDRGESAPGV